MSPMKTFIFVTLIALSASLSPTAIASCHGSCSTGEAIIAVDPGVPDVPSPFMTLPDPAERVDDHIHWAGHTLGFGNILP